MRLQGAQRATLQTTAIGILLILGSAFITPGYKMLYNPSESAPRGWYLFKSSHTFQRGEYVLAKLPDTAAKVASDRGYLPRAVPLLKHVAALGGQEVCRERDMITIDGTLIAHALEHDGVGRRLPQWTECRALTQDEVFLLSTDNPLSFDSRYFGPIPKAAVLGEALPLWTR